MLFAPFIIALLPLVSAFVLPAPALHSRESDAKANTSTATCIPQQGVKADSTYNLTGIFTDFCNGAQLKFTSGVVHVHSFHNSFTVNHVYEYCIASRDNWSGAKAIDAKGHRYRIQNVQKSDNLMVTNYTSLSFSSAWDQKGKIKLIGQGDLSNGVYEYNVKCTSSYTPQTGYHQTCDPNTYVTKCPKKD